MAIALLGSVATNNSQSGVTVDLTHTLDAGSNRIVVVGISAWKNAGSGPGITGVTYGGVAMTVLVEADSWAGGSTGYCGGIYYIREADLPGTGARTITVTFGASVDDCALVAQAFSGVDQDTTIRDSDSETTGSPVSPVTLDLTTQANDWAIDCLNQFNGTPTKGADQVDIGSGVGAGDNQDNYMSYEIATGATTTMSWSVSANDRALFAGVLIPAAGGGGSAPMFRGA